MHLISAFLRPATQKVPDRFIFVCPAAAASYEVPAGHMKTALTVAELAERFIADQGLPWQVVEVRPSGSDFEVICEDSDLN